MLLRAFARGMAWLEVGSCRLNELSRPSETPIGGSGRKRDRFPGLLPPIPPNFRRDHRPTVRLQNCPISPEWPGSRLEIVVLALFS